MPSEPHYPASVCHGGFMCGWSGHGSPTETHDDPLGFFLLFRGHHQWSNAFSQGSTRGRGLHRTKLKVFIKNDCDDLISSGCLLVSVLGLRHMLRYSRSGEFIPLIHHQDSWDVHFEIFVLTSNFFSRTLITDRVICPPGCRLNLRTLYIHFIWRQDKARQEQCISEESYR